MRRFDELQENLNCNTHQDENSSSSNEAIST